MIGIRWYRSLTLVKGQASERWRESSVSDELLTVAEVAGYLRISETTVYRLLQQGLLPGAKVGSNWRVSQHALDTFLAGEARRTPAGEGAGGGHGGVNG